MPACQKKCQLLNLEKETEKEPKISQSKFQSISLKTFGTEIVANHYKNFKLKFLVKWLDWRIFFLVKFYYLLIFKYLHLPQKAIMANNNKSCWAAAINILSSFHSLLQRLFQSSNIWRILCNSFLFSIFPFIEKKIMQRIWILSMIEKWIIQPMK